MAALAEQSRQLQAEQELLVAQAAEAARAAALPATPAAEPARGLRVFALGPLRVERDGGRSSAGAATRPAPTRPRRCSRSCSTGAGAA